MSEVTILQSICNPQLCNPAMMREAVIVASSRTPLAKSFRGSFNMTRPDDLAAHCIAHVLGKAPRLDPAEIEEVILGCGQPHGPAGHNVARVAALRAGLPVATAGVTVNRFCNSGLQAIVQAAHMIILEGVDAMIGGGVESITMMERDNSPNPWLQDHVPGLYLAMGDTAEVVAKRYHVSRRAQDELRAVQPAAHGAGRRTAASSRASWRPSQVRRADHRQDERRESRRRGRDGRSRRVQPPRHDPRGPRASCRRPSTPGAAMAA